MKEAQDRDLSLNALINAILLRYVTYYKTIERNGKVVVSRKSFQFILNNLDESLLLDSLKKNEFNLSNFISLSKGQIEFENFVNYALEGVGVTGGIIRDFDIYKDKQGYTNILLIHGYDIKWSKIIGNTITDLIKEIFHYNSQCTFYSSSLIIRIFEKSI